jgi:polar amino acid transport system substrate-binding protein
MAIVLFPGSVPAGTIVLATHELPPYGYHEADGRVTGYAVERVRFAVTRCGFELQLHVVPWARAQALARNDSVDGFFAASQNEERRELYVSSAVLAPQCWTWYLLQDSPFDPQSPEFKEKARVGSFIGANMLTYLEDNAFHIGGHPKDTEALFQMLLAHRLDAILANNLVATGVIRELDIDAEVRSQTLVNKPLYALFSRRFIREHPGFLECFNAALVEYERLHPVVPCSHGKKTSGLPEKSIRKTE